MVIDTGQRVWRVPYVCLSIRPRTRCSRPAPADNGIRGGRVSLSELDMAFHVRLPKDRMDRFADALDVARRLLLDWAG